jgi:hypothetical protein
MQAWRGTTFSAKLQSVGDAVVGTGLFYPVHLGNFIQVGDADIQIF